MFNMSSIVLKGLKVYIVLKSSHILLATSKTGVIILSLCSLQIRWRQMKRVGSVAQKLNSLEWTKIGIKH